ncbi:Exodeoxyribonuclease VII small subunit [Faunimonas pinastri]|uniref:Exodeoxyribonuclease 7 small subunit n=1 Tax=Faunimonas pinastri TaxID=1855383 RepID=A0A1H8ZXS6_9HYPH|nr:exodeoxyribonuclease VII small subunit [Faunimonas pinastri]SEP69047.1 Exodeoxyribonuclease VII small subunit [Faunimonas pinastri]
MSENATAEVATLSFENALKELESIVTRLERGDVPLEESIAIYERGEALKQRCDSLLKQAEERVEKIRTGPNGRAVGAEPFDAE